MNEFKTYHPIVNFTYFVFVIGFSMFFMHPVCLSVSLACGFTYSVLLKGKKAVCYEGFESQLEGAEIGSEPVVRDGNIITSIGAGTAVDFGLKLVEALLSENESERLRKAILCD